MENRYSQLIEKIFFRKYRKGVKKIEFRRDEIEKAASELNIRLPKNLGDVLYSFRFRTALPEKIRLTAPNKKEWLIKLFGRSKYLFSLEDQIQLVPNNNLREPL